jgi:ribonuclease HII
MGKHPVYDTSGPSFEIEAGLFAQGYRFIAGIDEAGRGALAGPLTLALVIYDCERFNACIPPEMEDINDSKKVIPRKREILRPIIEKNALVAIHQDIDVESVDKLNVNGATFEGVRALLEKSPVTPDCIIMDGNFNFHFPMKFIPVIKGDSRSITIASASIRAKVTRDALMCVLHDEYPGYGFNIHKGYGTLAHRDAIRTLGPSPVHRRSYEPVKSMLEPSSALLP